MNTLFDSFHDELEKIAIFVGEYNPFTGEAEYPELEVYRYADGSLPPPTGEAKRLADHRQRRGKKTRGAPSRSLKQRFPKSLMTLPESYDDTPGNRKLERAFSKGHAEALREALPGTRINLEKARDRNLRQKYVVGRHILRLEQSGASPEMLQKYKELFEKKHGKFEGFITARRQRDITRHIANNPGISQKRPGTYKELMKQFKRLI